MGTADPVAMMGIFTCPATGSMAANPVEGVEPSTASTLASSAGVRKPTGIVEMFGGQFNPMDRPGAIRAGLSSEGIDLKKMHDAFLCLEGNLIAGHKQHHQYNAKAENEPLHILLL